MAEALANYETVSIDPLDPEVQEKRLSEPREGIRPRIGAPHRAPCPSISERATPGVGAPDRRARPCSRHPSR